MGGSSSKSGPMVSTDHSALPQDTVPYTGPKLEFCILHVPVTIKGRITLNFSPGQELTTSDIDGYYPHLAGCYNDGYYLISFFRTPGGHLSGWASSTVPFQGIFGREIGTKGRRPCQLKIHKSMIHLQMLRSGILFGLNTAVDTNFSQVHSLITQECARGARFLCMELSGAQSFQGYGPAMVGSSPALGLDIFFEVPDNPLPNHYTMQAVSVPIHYQYTFGFGANVDAICDWMGNLALYLNQGWRLSDIFVASPDTSGTYNQVPVYSVNTVWFFEKETANLYDNTPRYEGTIVEYYCKLKAGLGGASCKLELAGILSAMGIQGWNLVCTVETGKIVSRGLASVTTVMLLFFQRPLMHVPSMPMPASYNSGLPQYAVQPPPPEYSSVAAQSGAPATRTATPYNGQQPPPEKQPLEDNNS